MATLTKRERVGEQMTLPSEVIATIQSIVKDRPSDEVPVIVSEVIETLAGRDPNWLLSVIKSAGGPSALVQAISEETRRLKSIGFGKT